MTTISKARVLINTTPTNINSKTSTTSVAYHDRVAITDLEGSWIAGRRLPVELSVVAEML